MSTDISNGEPTETELRELVYQSLENDGLITRLKAQLRAAVFKTIEKASTPSDVPHLPVLEGTTERICRALVLNWLEHSNLLYTHDLLKVESSGPDHPASLTDAELHDLLHLQATPKKSQSILHTLLDGTRSEKLNSLPDSIKRSIDSKFTTDKIIDITRVRDHFRSLFSTAFDLTVLDAFLNQNLSSSTVTKINYEQICLQWLQACTKALTAPSSPAKQTSPMIPIQRLTSQNGQITTRARRSFSPPSESNSSSSSTSHSENLRKGAFDFPLPTTIHTKHIVGNKSSDTIPPSLINFNSTNVDEEEDDSTSSLFSKRNTTRPILQKISINGHKDIPIEYDDDSISQMSSIDDVTVEKVSSSPSAHIDFFEDF